MPVSTRTLLKIIFNTLLGVVLIFAWLQFVNFEEIITTISSANFLFLIPAFLFMFLSLFVRSIRLKIFLEPVKKVSIRDLTFLNGVALMLNFLIPIRAGEFVKGFYLHTQYNLPLGKSIIWVFLDRFIDFVMVLVMASILLFLIPTQLDTPFAVTVTLIAVGVILATYLITYQAQLARSVISFFQKLLVFPVLKVNFERISHFFLETFSLLKRPGPDIVKLAGLSFLSYMADAFIWYFTFVSLGYPQKYVIMFLGQLLSALTYLIPAAPGYVGSAEASGSLILSGVFNIPVNLSSAMIVLFHVCTIVYVLVLGIVSVYGLKINLDMILKKALNRG